MVKISHDPIQQLGKPIGVDLDLGLSGILWADLVAAIRQAGGGTANVSAICLRYIGLFLAVLDFIAHPLGGFTTAEARELCL